MITNCLPYAVWISIIATCVLVFFCMLKKGTLERDESKVGFGVMSFIILLTLTFVTTNISVVATNTPTKAFISNTRVQTFVLNENKQLLFSLNLTLLFILPKFLTELKKLRHTVNPFSIEKNNPFFENSSIGKGIAARQAMEQQSQM